MTPRSLQAAVVLGVALVPAVAGAGNGLHPRTPVWWEDPGKLDPPPCMTVVDRSQDPVLHLEYTIPFEDTDVTTDEVEDSRRHQFIVFRQTGKTLDDVAPFECPSLGPGIVMPNWITSADVRAASYKGLLNDPAGPGHKTPDPVGDCCSIYPEDVLGVGAQWETCWGRVNADDDRREITFANAAAGVDWDTTGLPVGAYTIYGYTWEPFFNLWMKRPGVVRVLDSADKASAPPAAALAQPAGEDDVFEQGDMPPLELCVDAEPGSTVTISWAVSEAELTFEPLLEDAAIVNGDNMLQVDVPAGTPFGVYLLRADVTDPSNRTTTTYLDNTVTVLAAQDAVDDEAAPAEPSGADPTPDPPKPKKKDPGGCNVAAPGGPAWAWLLLLPVVGRRRGD